MIERFGASLKDFIAGLRKKERPPREGMVRTTVGSETLDVEVPDYVPDDQRQAYADSIATAFSGKPTFSDLTKK